MRSPIRASCPSWICTDLLIKRNPRRMQRSKQVCSCENELEGERKRAALSSRKENKSSMTCCQITIHHREFHHIMKVPLFVLSSLISPRLCSLYRSVIEDQWMLTKEHKQRASIKGEAGGIRNGSQRIRMMSPVISSETHHEIFMTTALKSLI